MYVGVYIYTYMYLYIPTLQSRLQLKYVLIKGRAHNSQLTYINKSGVFVAGMSRMPHPWKEEIKLIYTARIKRYFLLWKGTVSYYDLFVCLRTVPLTCCRVCGVCVYVSRIYVELHNDLRNLPT